MKNGVALTGARRRTKQPENCIVLHVTHRKNCRCSGCVWNRYVRRARPAEEIGRCDAMVAALFARWGAA